MTAPRRRLEILVDRPLAARIAAAAEAVGVSGYTLLPTLGGRGHGGRWSDDQVSGADTKVLFWTVTTQDKADALIASLSPLLDSYGLLVIASDVEVIRDTRF